MAGENDKLGRMSDAAEPRVGIFWMIATSDGAQLLAASCRLSEAESYGDCLTFGPGHYQIWQGWRRSRELSASARAVVREYEYEDWPRGRVVFDQLHARFIVYADRKLLRPETIASITQRFALPADRTDIKSDSHYQSTESPGLLA